MKNQNRPKYGKTEDKINPKERTENKIKAVKPKPKTKKELIAERKYLIRSRIAAARQRRKLENHPAGNRYVISRHHATRISSRPRITPDSTKSKKSTPGIKFGYSGTIIYDGKLPLHPFKWNPTDTDNSPNHYRWESLLPGTHVLDKNTCLVWIVKRPDFLSSKKTKKGELTLAPCQTIRLEMNLPDQLINFNPGLCLNPYLPETKQIPVGTRFIFKDSNQCYLLKENCQLAPINQSGTNRPSQIIPIPVNSVHNTVQLAGLNKLITHSPLQKRTPSLNGYQTLEEWLTGLTPGSSTLPGYLGDLPKVSQLQAYDVLEFYDPGLAKKNPRINGLNPDGTQYIDGLHESQHFSFRMQVILDAQGRLSGRELTEPVSQHLCNLNLPIESTNQERPIYLRSAALIPYLGEPIIILNQTEQPYYLDSEQDGLRLKQDLISGLLKAGYPYQQIKIDFLGQVQDYYTLRFNNLPTHLWGVVLSSDTQPHNKYRGSGRFFIGYTANSQGTTYSCELEAEDGSSIELGKLRVNQATIDGILVNQPDKDLSRNQEIAELLGQINRKLSDVGYPGYVINLWWNESNSKLKFYLSGIVNQQLPEIMLNINQTLIPLDFQG